MKMKSILNAIFFVIFSFFIVSCAELEEGPEAGTETVDGKLILEKIKDIVEKHEVSLASVEELAGEPLVFQQYSLRATGKDINSQARTFETMRKKNSAARAYYFRSVERKEYTEIKFSPIGRFCITEDMLRKEAGIKFGEGTLFDELGEHPRGFVPLEWYVLNKCNDPLKTCSGDNHERTSHEHGNGRRIQAVDGQAQSGAGH